MTIKNFEQVYPKRKAALINAIDRTNVLFRRYHKDLHRTDGKKWEDLYDWDFNLIHDLERRLEDRYTDNQWNYKRLYEEKYGRSPLRY